MAIPDALGLVRAYLDSLHADPVITRVPNPRPAKFIQVRRFGGAVLRPVRDLAQLDVFSWAADEPAAAALGATVRAEMLALDGTSLLGVECYSVEENLYRQFDDPETATPRMWGTYSLVLRSDDVRP